MNAELQTFTAGDTVKWTRTFAGYSGADGWSVSYLARAIDGVSKFAVAGVPDGSAFAFTLSAAASAHIVPGEYDFGAYAAKGDERFQVSSGMIVVRVNLASDASSVDTRSQNRRTLDAINATLENRASTDQQEYTIGNRSLKRTPIADLLAFKREFEAKVKAEEAQKALEQGRARKNRILVRF